MLAAIINTRVYACMFHNIAGKTMQSIAPCGSTFTASRCWPRNSNDTSTWPSEAFKKLLCKRIKNATAVAVRPTVRPSARPSVGPTEQVAARDRTANRPIKSADVAEMKTSTSCLPCCPLFLQPATFWMGSSWPSRLLVPGYGSQGLGLKAQSSLGSVGQRC